ncbi:MAG: hypothetical protein J6A79_17310 [Clostridia bacterium]|nr:hypothetical protein [Clostridia bacterium]
MIWFFLIILALAAYRMEFAPVGHLHGDYVGRESTRRINGLFTALIVMSHFVGYINMSGPYDIPYAAVRSHLNQAVVCTFLFYSGFGVMESITAKGTRYIRSIPQKRLLPVLLRLIAAILLFILVQAFYKKWYGIERILLSFIGWDSVGNSNWYIHGILVLYLVTFLAGMPLPSGKASRYVHAALVSAGTVCYVIFLRKAGKEEWWYNTLAMYSAGMWYSLLREKIEKILCTDCIWYLALSLDLLLYAASFDRRNESLRFFTIWVLCFMAVVLLLSMKVKLNSPFLDFMGTHIFSIYILQRIPMLILSRAGFLSSHKYIGLIVVYATTCSMAIVFDKYTKKVFDALFRARSVQSNDCI